MHALRTSDNIFILISGITGDVVLTDLKLSDTGAEAEPVTKSGPVPANPLSSSVQSMAPAKLAIGAAPEDGFDKKAWKLRLSRKINGIYGDWLDDGSSPRGSPSKDEI